MSAPSTSGERATAGTTLPLLRVDGAAGGAGALSAESLAGLDETAGLRL